MNFPMVITASGIARGRVRTTTTTTESPDCRHTPNNRLTETYSLGLPFTSLLLDIHVTINDTCQNKVSAD